MSAKLTILGAFLFATFTLAAPDLISPQSIPELPVPDAQSALKIAEPALIKKYRRQHIDYERPLTARLEEGIWTVYGTLCCPGQNGRRTYEKGKCVAGVAALKLRQSDG